MVVSGFALGRLLDCPDLPTKLSPIPRISAASPVQTRTAPSIFGKARFQTDFLFCILPLCLSENHTSLESIPLKLCDDILHDHSELAGMAQSLWHSQVVLFAFLCFSGHCGNRLVYDQGCLDAQHLTVAQLPAFPGQRR